MYREACSPPHALTQACQETWIRGWDGGELHREREKHCVKICSFNVTGWMIHNRKWNKCFNRGESETGQGEWKGKFHREKWMRLMTATKTQLLRKFRERKGRVWRCWNGTNCELRCQKEVTGREKVQTYCYISGIQQHISTKLIG